MTCCCRRCIEQIQLLIVFWSILIHYWVIAYLRSLTISNCLPFLKNSLRKNCSNILNIEILTTSGPFEDKNIFWAQIQYFDFVFFEWTAALSFWNIMFSLRILPPKLESTWSSSSIYVYFDYSFSLKYSKLGLFHWLQSLLTP